LKLLARFLPVFVFFILVFACRQDKKSKMIEVKVLEYHVEYVDDVAGSVPTSILPEKMSLIFYDQKALTTIEGFLGQFSLSYLADLKKQRVVTMLKLFDRNFYYQGEEGELPAGIVSFEDMIIEKTGDSAMIMDFMARKYIVRAGEIDSKEIWSTEEIDIRNPNIITPYREIPGVLLQFYSQLSVLKMHLVIEKYQEKTISEDMMQVPDSFKRISKSTMEKTLEELFR